MTRALILTGDGINCEAETAYAFEKAGAKSHILHVNALLQNPKQLLDYPILALPGGFSFGDEISSGKILALKLRHGLGDVLQQFVAQDRLVLGICNGFQALVKLGLLPDSTQMTQQVTLTHNRQKHFINRWVWVSSPEQNLFFENSPERFMLPIRHGEGRLMVPESQEQAMKEALKPHTALSYAEDVNGSFQQIAGLVNAKGTVLGLMPHPEAFVRWTHHPAWTSLSDSEKSETPVGLRVFENMVQATRS